MTSSKKSDDDLPIWKVVIYLIVGFFVGVGIISIVEDPFEKNYELKSFIYSNYNFTEDECVSPNETAIYVNFANSKRTAYCYKDNKSFYDCYFESICFQY